ncbi:hypothetical protein BBJ28_00022005 [Nothophytophthora sp. Chile5]|nr:hypothetical protein BBJ28_00022005 [Nothophytophthora sp. Chile5]
MHRSARIAVMRGLKPPFVLVLVLFAMAAVSTTGDGGQSVVNVPEGVTTVLLDGHVVQEVDCWVPPDAPSMFVDLTLTDGNGTRMDSLVAPRTLVFLPEVNATARQYQKQTFTLFGRVSGRFYLAYALSGDQASSFYRLSADSSVVSVATQREPGWQGVWYQLLFNSVVFAGGLAFFAWQRLHQVELPIWKGHQEALFERTNYDDLSPETFATNYAELHGATVRERMKRFWAISCSGDYVCTTCGVPAALMLRFYGDCGHLFAILSFFSMAAMLPNYWPGSAQHTNGSDTYQETTFSNVPLHSDWYWAHVGYCYLVAFGVLHLLRRQHELSSALRRRSKHIVGARSIFIHHGLPVDTTSKSLRAALRSVTPREGAVHEVTVLQDLSVVHQLLVRRRELSEALSRIQALDEAYETGTLSWNLLCCPGSVLVPRPLECCCPKHSPKAVKRPSRSDTMYESLADDSAVQAYDMTAARKLFALHEELDFFPEDALDEYAKRRCMGAAFVIFDSTATRNAFVRVVRGQSCVGRIVNTAEALARRGFRDQTPLLTPESTISEPLAPILQNLVLESAPEPDDVIWRDLQYKPHSLRRTLAFLVRQLATVALLLLFSTPTAVLMFIKLDSGSAVYRGLDRRNTALLTLLASYLPSLLLVRGGWMSSVFLPSIGVTAAYLALSDLEKTGGHSYVESFLYKVSGTFFISYVCQRAFLGAIVDLTRCADLVAYQPWVHSRSVTPLERQQALRPSAFPFGHDYALVLSILLVVLLGTVITPIITPFGALYFYLKLATTKYNMLYVLPYNPGRGHIAHTAYALTFVCLLLFELVMALVFLQVAGRKHFVAMLVLLVTTGAVYFSRLSGMEALALVQQGLADLRRDSGVTEYDATAVKSPPGSASRRTILGPAPTDLEHEDALVATYADPYKAALSIFKLLGVNQFRHMTSTRTQLRYAFIHLRRYAQRPLPTPEPKKRRWWQRKEKKERGEGERGVRGWWRRHRKERKHEDPV